MTSETDLGDRPETDPEVIYRALEHVAKKRNVEVGLVLDGGTITPNSARSLIIKRFKQIPNSKIYWCENGCFNTNKPNVFPTAINHEKFLTISDTIWDKTPDRTRSSSPALVTSRAARSATTGRKPRSSTTTSCSSRLSTSVTTAWSPAPTMAAPPTRSSPRRSS